MGIRFFRRLKLLPGVRLNMSRSGPSVSVGPRGAHVTVGPRGTSLYAGLPGTGLSYRQQIATPARHAAASIAHQIVVTVAFGLLGVFALGCIALSIALG